MAGYNLEDMNNFARGNKAKRGSKRDMLVKDNDKVHYEVWGNRIATLSPRSGQLNITDAGWQTKLTKDRLNQVLPRGEGYISQRKGQWYYNRDEKEIPFRGSMTIPVHEHIREVNGQRVRVREHLRRY